MNSKETDLQQSKGNAMYALLQLLMIAVAIIFVGQGISALQDNTIVTATTKHGPLTGVQALIIGAACILWGLVSIVIGARRSNQAL